MTKIQFLLSLNNKLSHLPQKEVEERLNFYSEMIEDRMEEGLLEEDAVAAVGSIEEISAQITNECPKTEPPMQKRRLSWWEITLLAVGSPIWISLLVSVIAIIFSLYATLWSVIISLWAIFAAIVGCTVAGIAAGICLLCVGKKLPGIALIGAGLICAGLSILLLFGCKAATKAAAQLTKKVPAAISKCFTKKEAA